MGACEVCVHGDPDGLTGDEWAAAGRQRERPVTVGGNGIAKGLGEGGVGVRNIPGADEIKLLRDGEEVGVGADSSGRRYTALS